MLVSDQLCSGAITPCLAREVELHLRAEPQAQFYSAIFVPSGYQSRPGHDLTDTPQLDFYKTKFLNEDSVEPVTNKKKQLTRLCLYKNEIENEQHCGTLPP